ncbi:MAG: hypothetical protein DCC75_08920 [Proteobacteria bacterium]|nr:MAG: hypothetical protein DCC75_08920 [Pseudomonadota bacterium]
MINQRFQGSYARGALIVEFILALPILLLFFVAVLELGRNIKEQNDLLPNAANAALLGAGFADSGRHQSAQDVAQSLYNISSSNQVEGGQAARPFQASYDDSRELVEVDYSANIRELMPPMTIGSLSLSFTRSISGKVTMPYLVKYGSTGANYDSPQNLAIYCANGNPAPAGGCAPINPPPSCVGAQCAYDSGGYEYYQQEYETSVDYSQ